jgi:hypothetical protein
MQKVIIFLVLSALLSACAAIPQSGAAGFVNLNELQPLGMRLSLALNQPAALHATFLSNTVARFKWHMLQFVDVP